MSKDPKAVQISRLTTEYHLGTQKIAVDQYSTGTRVSIPIAQSLTLDRAKQVYELLQYILTQNGKLNAQ